MLLGKLGGDSKYMFVLKNTGSISKVHLPIYKYTFISFLTLTFTPNIDNDIKIASFEVLCVTSNNMVMELVFDCNSTDPHKF